MTEASSDEVLTSEEAAAFLKMSERTLLRLAASGEVPGSKIGGQWRFVRTELVDRVRGTLAGEAGR